MFNKSVKKCVFVYCMCYNILMFKWILLQISVSGVAAINEQQQQQIERLKSELFEALENDNVELATRGVIVQPSWTHFETGKTESAKVEVNAQNRNEAAALRAEIEQAVAKDSYATPGVTKTQDIKLLEASLRSKEKSGEARIFAHGKPSKIAAREEGHLGAPQEHQEASVKGPNIITANLYVDSEIDARKLQRLEVSKRRTREVLALKYIEEDFSFDLGADVNEWKHIVHAGQEYFIGRRVRDLLIVRKEGDKYRSGFEVDVGHVITDIEAYTYWNSQQEEQEDVIIVATDNKVLWYRANPAIKSVELYWEWLIGNVITGLTHFGLDLKNFLVVSSNHSLHHHYALNIYQFELESKEFWIAQRLQLNFPSEGVAVLNSGRDIILAVPQNNTAQIYTFNPHEAEADSSYIHFKLKISVAAEGISLVAGFKMGGHSYLALTGYRPQILLYQQGDFISKTLLGANFGLVELFLPIPVSTYRDDLILLVQHRVDFSTHSVTVVETLIWDGEAFETSIPVPCHLGKSVVYGVGCMLDLHRNEGLKGAALLNRGNEVAIIVPRYKAESGLFRFHTELLAKNSELLDLQDIFDFLQGWVKEQDDLVAEAEAFLQIPNEALVNFKPDVAVIESLKTPEFELNGNVAEIFVNDHKWTTDDSAIDFNLIIQDLEDLERSLNSGRQRRNLYEKQYDYLDFDEVNVENLEVEKVNGQECFVQNGQLNFDGIIYFDELEVLEKPTNIQKRQLNDEDFNLNGSLEFDQINGVDWSEIKNNLVFKTQSQNFKHLEVKGEVLIENLLTINTLNALNFPEDYMLTDGPATSTVTAEKHFANTLSVSSLDTNGFVNGKNPMDAITLTDPQEWHGMPVFKHLEIAEVFELHGKVHGHDGQKLPQNPTLQETHNIEATCHFSEIIINGPLVLKGELDDKPLGTLLKDIILKSQNPADEILVPSRKSFNVISFPTDFELENSAINKIPVSEFVTQHTSQTLNLTSLEGYVYFHNLTLSGSYDGIKIEDVLEEVILLNKPVDLSNAELSFPENIKASSVTILDTLNKHEIKDNLQTLQEDLSIEAAEFESLHTQQADLSNGILGQGKLNNIELHSFINEKSLHEPPLRGNIFLNELILEKGIKTEELHGIDAESLLDFLNQMEDLPDMVLNGQIQVGYMTVSGDIQLHKLNGLLFDEEIQLTAIKLHHPNFLSTNLSFRNLLEVSGGLNVIGDFGGRYLPNLIEDIVIRTSNSCVEIAASKSFAQPVEVLRNTHIEALNGISMSNIAWKTKDNSFDGSVHLKGNLVVQNVNVIGKINDLKWQDLQSLFYFDGKLQNFVLKDIIEFDSQLYLDDLTVIGDLNSVRNLAEFFENLIYKNKISVLNGKNTFTGRISIGQGALIKYLNGHDLLNLFNNVVLVHGPQPIIMQAPLTFKGPIYANEIEVENSLRVEHISGCSLKEWANNTLRVDRDENIPRVLRFAPGSIDGNSLLVDFIDDIDLSRILTLNTPQAFNETAKFSEAALNGFISCNGWINDVDIEEEFNNTFMTYGQQHIFTPLNIENITVLGDLNIRGLVNKNMDLRDVATLQEDLVFKTPLYFQSIYCPQVTFKDLVTGINFNKWFESAIKNNYSGTQYITGNWSTKSLTVRTRPQDFQYVINNFDPWQYYSFLRFTRSEDRQVYDKNEMCPLITQILQAIDRKSVYVKYIQEDFNIKFAKELKDGNESIHKLFEVKANQEHFLLANFKCKSFMYKWQAEENKFTFKTSFESGPINEIEVMPASNNSKKLQFITSFETAENLECDLKGVKNWKVENDSIVLESDIPWSPALLYKPEGNNSSFWALRNGTIQELDLDYKIKQKWQLPIEQNKTRYRFVPLKREHEILLTNGEQLVLVSQYLANKSAKSFLKAQESQVRYYNFSGPQFGDTESLLKPNSTVTRSFVFADFTPVIERILTDLKQRLNQQVNITQLSIPESDLFDEHLVPDFMAIMTELQEQNIYDSKVFNVSFNNIIVPEHPAQVLAARVVQIAWPAVVEIRKIHSYFKSNENHDHPLCSCIIKSLGFLMNDVLTLANIENNPSDAEDLKLYNVIDRIREFESDLETFFHDNQNYYGVKLETENFTNGKIQAFATKHEENMTSHSHKVLMFEKKSFLPGFKQGEIISLEVGSITHPLNLWAVANKNVAISGNNPGIYIYIEGVMGQLYQVISATLPRSLQHLRIKQETLLLYVQECCQVKILKYRGSQGFTTFAEIHRNEPIKQILVTSLPSSTGNSKYFLILLLESDIKFYEFVIEGYGVPYTSSTALIPSNCL